MKGQNKKDNNIKNNLNYLKKDKDRLNHLIQTLLL